MLSGREKFFDIVGVMVCGVGFACTLVSIYWIAVMILLEVDAWQPVDVGVVFAERVEDTVGEGTCELLTANGYFNTPFGNCTLRTTRQNDAIEWQIVEYWKGVESSVVNWKTKTFKCDDTQKACVDKWHKRYSGQCYLSWDSRDGFWCYKPLHVAFFILAFCFCVVFAIRIWQGPKEFKYHDAGPRQKTLR